MQNKHNLNFPGTSVSDQPLTHRSKKLRLRQPHIWVFDSDCRFKLPHLAPTNLNPTSAFQQGSKMSPISKRPAVPQHQIPIIVCCNGACSNIWIPILPPVEWTALTTHSTEGSQTTTGVLYPWFHWSSVTTINLDMTNFLQRQTGRRPHLILDTAPPLMAKGEGPPT
jgi:hypothetical protein